jgi:hypothetical protein
MSNPEFSRPVPLPRGAGQRLGTGAILLAVVFVAGAVAGAALDRAWIRTHLVRVAGGWTLAREIRVPRPTGDSVTDRLREVGVPDQFLRLHLTSEQAMQLAEIAQRRRPRSDSINAVVKRLQPTVQRLETEMMQEMLCALSPSQQADWLEYMKTNGWNPNVVAERYRLVQTHTCPAQPR